MTVPPAQQPNPGQPPAGSPGPQPPPLPQPFAPQPQAQPTPSQTQPMQPAPPGPPGKPKRFGWPTVIITAVVALGVGGLVGGADQTSTTATPAATATVTEAVQAGAEPSDQPTEEPTQEPTGFTPHKSDFKIGIKTLKKTCFGSAGCNVTFRINPEYVGSQELPDEGVIEVTYKVTGAEDPIENTFTIEGGKASYEKEEDASTRSGSAKLVAKVTDVSYEP
jgi:hypothetical protein